jgi:hypothetical protein
MSEYVTQVIDGKKYAEVGRKAEVGEKVVINGRVFTVNSSYRDGIYYYYESPIKRYCAHENYRVLEPLEQDVTDIIANLARRVLSLEQQLEDTQGNCEKLAEELATVKHLADSNERGIAMLDVFTQPKSSARLLSEAFDALSSYERMSRR